MKPLFAVLAPLVFNLCSQAQTAVKLEDISKHIGDSVKIKGQVSAEYLSSSKCAPTLLDLAAAFPNQLFTVVVSGDDRNKFKDAPESYYNGK